MLTLTNKEIRSYEKQKYAIYVKKRFDMIKTKKSLGSFSLHREI